MFISILPNCPFQTKNYIFFFIVQPSKWPGYKKNKQSVGELFVGFFRFYLEEFDFLKQVVAMKQSKPLYKFEKSWSSAVVAIEGKDLLSHLFVICLFVHGIGFFKLINLFSESISFNAGGFVLQFL